MVAIAVIAAVATQIPRFRRTAAENPAAQTSATEPAVSSQPAESNRMPDSAQSETPVAPDAVPSQTTGTIDSTHSAPPVPPAAPPRASVQAHGGLPAAKAGLKAAWTPDAQIPPASPTEPVPAVRETAPPPPPAENPQIAEQRTEVREQLNLLSVRAGTVKSSLDNLRRRQAASGLGLRSDMAGAAQRMEYYLSQAESALDRRDAESARKNLDLAEREVSKLESFLGK